MRKRILVVGFGNIGCRHVQSLISQREKFDVHIVEPIAAIVEANSHKIGARSCDYTVYDSLTNLKNEFDLAIVATSAGPRYEIVNYLIQYGVRYFLLEKIVFQSDSQFLQIKSSMNEVGATAYCNFVNRYIESYDSLRRLLLIKKCPIRMIVHGGDFGLGCNAIHYIDLFQYLLNSANDLVTIGSDIQLSKLANKRGESYKEFTGTISFSDLRGSELYITAEQNFNSGVSVTIEFSKLIYRFNEQTTSLTIFDEGRISSEQFEIQNTSKITSRIVDEIFDNACRLPQLKDVMLAHGLLFQSFNVSLGYPVSREQICPIT